MVGITSTTDSWHVEPDGRNRRIQPVDERLEQVETCADPVAQHQRRALAGSYGDADAPSTDA